MERFSWPAHPIWVERADRWLAELPELDFLNVHLLFRIEMYFGCWGGPLALGYPDACSTTVYPFGQRAVLESLMRMPAADRGAGTVRTVIVERRWPELLEIPINRPTPRVAARAKFDRGTTLAAAAGRKARRTLTAALHALHR